MACIKLRITVVPLSISIKGQELQNIIRECNPSYIYTDQMYLLKCYVDKVKNIYCTQEHDESNYMVYEQNTKRQEDYTVFILFSSGTTGEMKGIECTESAIIAATMSINEVIENTSEDNILCFLDFSFDYGLYQVFLAIEVGASITICNTKENILRIPDYIYKYCITGFPATPFLLKVLLETRRISPHKFVSLKYITSTGDHLCSTIIEQYKSLLPSVKIFPMYGLTECKRVSILRPEEYESHKNSVGRPISCNNVKIIDTFGREVPNGCEGELVVVGTNIMKGYYGDEKLTAKKFVQREDGNVELHTGDIFVKDDDDFLYFISRTHNFIKVREKKISPLSIEKSLIEQVGSIVECAIVPVRDNEISDELFCFLRLKKGYEASVVINEIYKIIPKAIFPRFFCIWNSMFLYNSNGKLDRKAMAEKAKEVIKEGTYIIP